MDNTMVYATCSFCGEAIVSQWGKIKLFNQNRVDIYYRTCLPCYDRIQRAIRQALTGVIKQMLQESLSEFKQELLAAGLKK